jgi:hypothetical protein
VVVHEPERPREPTAGASLLRYVEGATSPPIALLHLLTAFEDPAALLDFLAESAEGLEPGQSRAAERLAALRTFAQGHLDGLRLVRRMGVYHAQALAELPARGIDAIRDLYDRLVEIDPASAVALYSFGDPHVLDAASAEVVTYLQERSLLSSTTRMLELGCGIGRLLEACAGSDRSLTGIDVSPRMVAFAATRVERLRNVRVQLCNGLDLQGFPAQSLDLVVAADTWPCVVMLGPGAVRRLAQEVARVLVPGGELVVLNFSYRADASMDRADIRALASAFGF